MACALAFPDVDDVLDCTLRILCFQGYRPDLVGVGKSFSRRVVVLVDKVVPIDLLVLCHPAPDTDTGTLGGDAELVTEAPETLLGLLAPGDVTARAPIARKFPMVVEHRASGDAEPANFTLVVADAVFKATEWTTGFQICLMNRPLFVRKIDRQLPARRAQNGGWGKTGALANRGVLGKAQFGVLFPDPVGSDGSQLAEACFAFLKGKVRAADAGQLQAIERVEKPEPE